MRQSLCVLFAFSYITIGLAACSSNSEAQEVKNFLRDYRDERVFNYQPTDPDDRGKVFQMHTGHYGGFYNCDGEENKRNSPYICWKAHHERDFPQRLGFWENLRRDISEVKQRINDGGCGNCDQGCECSDCQQATSVAQPTCSCADCIAESQTQPGIRIAKSNPYQSRQLMDNVRANGRLETLQAPKHGLVSGKILGNETGYGTGQASVARTSVTPTLAASGSYYATKATAPTSMSSLARALQEQEGVRQAQAQTRQAKSSFWNKFKVR